MHNLQYHQHHQSFLEFPAGQVGLVAQQDPSDLVDLELLWYPSHHCQSQ